VSDRRCLWERAEADEQKFAFVDGTEEYDCRFVIKVRKGASSEMRRLKLPMSGIHQQGNLRSLTMRYHAMKGYDKRDKIDCATQTLAAPDYRAGLGHPRGNNTG
jgi:hypothetical protein